MTFHEIVREISRKPDYLSGYRPGLKGIIQVLGNQLIFRDQDYQVKDWMEDLTLSDIEAKDWRIVTKID